MSSQVGHGELHRPLDDDDAPITHHRTPDSVSRAQMMLAADEGRSASMDGDGDSEDDGADPQSETGRGASVPSSVGGPGTVASSSRPIGRLHAPSTQSASRRPAWDAPSARGNDADGTAVPSDIASSLMAMEQDVAALYNGSSSAERYASQPPPSGWVSSPQGFATRPAVAAGASGSLPMTVDACHHVIAAQRGQIVQLAARVAQLEQIAASLREQGVQVRVQGQRDLSTIAIMRERVAAAEAEITQLRLERDDLLQQRLEQTRRARDAATRASELQSALSSLDRDKAFGFASGRTQAMSLSLFGTASPAAFGRTTGISPSARAARAAIAGRVPSTSPVVPIKPIPSGATYRPPPTRVSGSAAVGGMPVVNRSMAYGAPAASGNSAAGASGYGASGYGFTGAPPTPAAGNSLFPPPRPGSLPPPQPPRYYGSAPNATPSATGSGAGTADGGASVAAPTPPRRESSRALVTAGGGDGDDAEAGGVAWGRPLASVPFFQTVLAGIPVIKHSAWPAKPKHQLVWLDVAEPLQPAFCWGPPAERAHPVASKRLGLRNITTLNTGLSSKRLARYGREEDSGRYMTFGSKTRSLDLEFATEADCAHFFERCNTMFRAFAEAIQGGMEGEAVVVHVAQSVDGAAAAASLGRRPSYRG